MKCRGECNKSSDVEWKLEWDVERNVQNERVELRMECRVKCKIEWLFQLDNITLFKWTWFRGD